MNSSVPTPSQSRAREDPSLLQTKTDLTSRERVEQQESMEETRQKQSIDDSDVENPHWDPKRSPGIHKAGTTFDSQFDEE